jgi:hypothetical protein
MPCACAVTIQHNRPEEPPLPDPPNQLQVLLAACFNECDVNGPCLLHGELVAGGRGKGDANTQFGKATNIVVDRMGAVYVTDRENHRVMKWSPGTFAFLSPQPTATPQADRGGSRPLRVSRWGN